jgi:hypothetical protein
MGKGIPRETREWARKGGIGRPGDLPDTGKLAEHASLPVWKTHRKEGLVRLRTASRRDCNREREGGKAPDCSRLCVPGAHSAPTSGAFGKGTDPRSSPFRAYSRVLRDIPWPITVAIGPAQRRCPFPYSRPFASFAGTFPSPFTVILTLAQEHVPFPAPFSVSFRVFRGQISGIPLLRLFRVFRGQYLEAQG